MSDEPDRAARFYARVNENGPIPQWRPDLGPCHLWKRTSGYGYFEGKAAHRVALEMVGVEIPPKYVVDHLCRRHACVRPSHLEPVTTRENFIRSDHPCAIIHRRGTAAPVQQPEPRPLIRFAREVIVLWKLIDGGWHHYDLASRDGWKATYIRCEERGFIVRGEEGFWQITDAGRAHLDWVPWAHKYHPDVYS